MQGWVENIVRREMEKLTRNERMVLKKIVHS